MGSYKVFAHRGACREAPENSLEAFTLAFEMGADAIECDLHLSQDGEVVCHHDPVREGNRLIDLSADELRRRWGIATLDEILELDRGDSGLMLELKRDHSDLEELVKNTIKILDHRDGPIWVGSLSPMITELLVKHNCPYPIFGGANEPGDLTQQLVFQPPILSIRHTWPTDKEIKGWVSEGYELWFWTVNDMDRAKHLGSLGAHAIITDLPRQMLAER